MSTSFRTTPRRTAAGIALVAAFALAACGGTDQEGDRAQARPPSTPATSPSTTTAPATSGATTPPTAQPPAGAGLARGTPARIAIDAIGVDAPVVDLNRNPDGTLQVPDWQDAGWWERGPEPGERGPAVVVGHVDSQAGPAVFARLEELVAGDVIDIALDGGGTTSYVVDRAERFAKDAFPTRAVYDLTAGPELRLITCDGEFDEATGHYVDNLVVFATPA